MRFITGIAMAAVTLGGCQTLSFGERERTTLTTVTTTPAGARVTVEGFGECETPCTIEIDKPRNITIAKAGFDTQKFVLLPGRKKLDVVLKLSAPTTGVDAEELPEL
ncbi:MAG: PEGA domain-containing protein [Pseudomonadota bacterium]